MLRVSMAAATAVVPRLKGVIWCVSPILLREQSARDQDRRWRESRHRTAVGRGIGRSTYTDCANRAVRWPGWARDHEPAARGDRPRPPGRVAPPYRPRTDALRRGTSAWSGPPG